MSEASPDLAHTVQLTVDRQIDRLRPTPGIEFNGADLLSLAALAGAWTSILSIWAGEPNYGLVAMFAAYGFDKLDGFYARRFDCTSSAGRRLDSFVDVFIYLLTGALLFHVTMAPTLTVSAVVGFVLIACGGLRLVRFNAEGFGTDGDTSFYRGLTVVHANLAVVANYFLLELSPSWNGVPLWTGWTAGATIAIVAPLMLSNYRSYKTWGRQALVGICGVVAVGLALALEFG